MKQVGINIGFITNSSSVVYHFPRELLKDKNVAAFIEAMGIQDGFVGSNLWDRGDCETFATTKEQKAEALKALAEYDWGLGDDFKPNHPPIPVNEDDRIVVVIGDEYPGLTMTLAQMLKAAAKAAGVGYFSDDYN